MPANATLTLPAMIPGRDVPVTVHGNGGYAWHGSLVGLCVNPDGTLNGIARVVCTDPGRAYGRRAGATWDVGTVTLTLDNPYVPD